MSHPSWQRWTPPEVFDEYRLLHAIGRGGMGQVYLAHDLHLDRQVALKFISAVEPDAVSRQRFLIEARAVARLQHPNVVAIYRVGEVDRHPYIASELVHGRSLNLMPRPMPWQRVLRVGIGLSRGLAAAHEQGVLHRDIKPGNAMISDADDVKLLDFGLAKFTGEEDFGGDALQFRGEQSGTGLTNLKDVPGHSGEDPLTQQGTVMGTPLYMAPETLRGEPASPRSDVYSLGAVLYELCAGVLPHVRSGAVHAPSGTASSANVPPAPHPGDPPPLCDQVDGLDPDLGAIIDRCLRADPAHRFASGAELRDALLDLVPEVRAANLPDGNPYRGLLSFEAEHRDFFFGRGPETRAVLERLRGEALLLVTGDSGVGKSSLCRASVLPLCGDGALDPKRSFRVVQMVPGKHPLSALASTLSPCLHEPEDFLLGLMSQKPSAIFRALRQRCGHHAGVVLFIDQMEELFTLSDPIEARLLGTILGDLAVPTPGVRVLLTARSDFLTRLATLPGLLEQMPRCLYFLRALSAQGVREAITGPARRKGFAFESEAMVATLIGSATQAGSLPLLQFALAELWEGRDRQHRVVPQAALLAIGGVSGALARHADGVMAVLPVEERQAARRILIRLVTVEGTRARRTREELGTKNPATQAALEALIRSRLLSARQAEGHILYEVAHEALISGWDTLRGWLHAEADRRAARQRIETAAAGWERLGGAREALFGRRQLAEASRVDPADLSDQELAFLRASRRGARRLDLLRRALFIGLPLLVGLIYGVLRLQAQRELDHTITAHVAQAEAALKKARGADRESADFRGRAFAIFDQAAQAGQPGMDPDAERLWQGSLSADLRAERSYIQASQALENALLLDTGRPSVRGLLGDVTYERILLAERMHRDAAREEELQRLPNYDPQGMRMRRLNDPARLRLTISPRGTSLKVLRFVEQDRHLLPREVSGIGAAPAGDLVLPAGSYLLVLTAPERPELRLPVLLARGESLRLSLELPEAVPPGFVYVPPGRFLYGSADDESLRTGFFNTTPLHERTTAGYLIGRTEVTFGEWLEFLRDLPKEERRQRTPRTGELHGGLLLSERTDHRFTLTLQPTTQVYLAVEGEPIRYGSRQRRAEQDWRRFPVSAISLLDMEAYLHWLSRTGRVPGARLCDEREWERAARGADGRPYPQGSALLPDDANFDETYGRNPLGFGPDEVGSHPASDSPFGLHDMAGNVWEMTRSARDPSQIVLRGGCWYEGGPTHHTMNRELAEPSLRSLLMGLRVCASFPAP